ncbi:unnamed protein product [Triticum turgidum subsp. durum]|uniref:C2H2-type domain-containing protein n=1 Tax=Triticum turgidum subsp. durum TaxID=4567 RepID=A0A9R0WFM6_TRITD|nr:unnamed protein product [Triticum turgidum subsp. durum]
MEGAHVVDEATAEQEVGVATPLANGSVTNPEVTGGASLVIVSGSITETEVMSGVSLANEAVGGREVSTGVSLVSGSIAEPEVISGASLADEAVAETEVSGGLCLVSEAATEAADVATSSGITTGAPLDNKGTAEPEIKIGPSFANESTAEMDSVLLGSLVTEATTHPGLIGRVSLVTETGVTGGANLDTEVSIEPEDTGRPSLLNESTKLEITRGVSIATDAASEPEVTGQACSGDGDAALNEPETLDCDLDSANVQIENAGESVATEVQPSRDDKGDVGYVNAMSTCPVTDKSLAFDEVIPQDDAPGVSCASGVVVRSVGKSGRSDVICYARRRGKRKLDMEETKTDQLEMGDGDIYGREEKATFDITVPCESAMSTAESADIKLADIKRGLVDNSASSKGKKRKGRFECDIDYCHMTFKKRAELSVHKKNMCTIKSCGKHFRSHKYLRRHQSIHNEEAPYKCPWEGCSMAFKWTWALADHFQVHTGEKPYKCRTPGCSKIYKYVSDFTRHRMRCKAQR